MMKLTILLSLFVLRLLTYGEDQKPAPTLKSVLLEQLRTTHNQKEWFVPANVAVEGLTAEQANWKDGKGDVVREVNGKRVDTADQYRKLLASIQPGDAVTLEVVRERKDVELRLTAGTRP